MEWVVFKWVLALFNVSTFISQKTTSPGLYQLLGL